MSRAMSALRLVTNIALGGAVWAAVTGRLADGALGETAASGQDARAAKGGTAESPGQVASGAGSRGAPDIGVTTVAGGVSRQTRSEGRSPVPPLFRAAVLPPPREEPAAPPPPEPPPRLLGVIIGGTGAIAVMQAGDAPPKRLRVQDEVEGWTVTRIEAKRVVMQRGEDVATVRLDSITN
jgi:hypothetical protein